MPWCRCCGSSTRAAPKPSSFSAFAGASALPARSTPHLRCNSNEIAWSIRQASAIRNVRPTRRIRPCNLKSVGHLHSQERVRSPRLSASSRRASRRLRAPERSAVVSSRQDRRLTPTRQHRICLGRGRRVIERDPKSRHAKEGHDARRATAHLPLKIPSATANFRDLKLVSPRRRARHDVRQAAPRTRQLGVFPGRKKSWSEPRGGPLPRLLPAPNLGLLGRLAARGGSHRREAALRRCAGSSPAPAVRVSRSTEPRSRADASGRSPCSSTT